VKGAPWLFLLCLSLGLPAQAAILRVEADGSGQYPTIQAAMNAAAPGDTVELGDGLYSGPGNRNLDFQSGLLRSASGDPQSCRIDCGGEAIGQAPEIHLLWLRGIGFENGSPLTGEEFGTLGFSNCRFENCDRLVTISSPLDSDIVLLSDCQIRHCDGLLLKSTRVILERCRFEENTGKVSETGLMQCSDCDFIDNTAPMLFSHYFWMNDSIARYQRCRFEGNQVEILFGLGHVDIDFEQCRFFGNTGIVMEALGYYFTLELTIAGCSFVANASGGEASIQLAGGQLQGSVTIERSLFAFEQGAALFTVAPNNPSIQLSDCDLHANAGGDWGDPVADQYGVGCNMSADPLFCDWPAGDLTLREDSPCLPANNACGVQIGAEGQGCADPTAVEPAPGGELRLAAQPNPFNPTTRLSFTLPQAAPVDLVVFDTAGRRVAVLLDNAPRPAGTQSVDWEARGLTSGVYLARLEAGGQQQVTKLTLLR